METKDKINDILKIFDGLKFFLGRVTCISISPRHGHCIVPLVYLFIFILPPLKIKGLEYLQILLSQGISAHSDWIEMVSGP